MEQANPFQPAIAELEKDLAELERQGNALLTTINVLRGKAGMPPRPAGFGSEPSGSGASEGATVSSIQHDTFFGKKMSTSARMYLDMRKAANLGPGQAREILDALQKGGYQFETKDDATALASLRNMLNKYTVMFQKLPNGSYGLKTWYPDMRKPRATGGKTTAPIEPEDDVGEDDPDVIHMPDESASQADAA